jgi:hypothetical protein
VLSYSAPHNNEEENKMSNKIDITPSWETAGEILIMALQNKKLDKKGFDNVFANIRDMASKMDLANNIIRKLKEEKNNEK